MTDYAYDMPRGRELEADPPTHAFGQNFMTATAQALADCRELGLEELTENQIDFSRTSDRKLYLVGESGYFRYHLGTLESARDAGVSAYFIQAPGYLVLLHRPNAEKVVSEWVADVPVGREATLGTRIQPSQMPGAAPVLPRR